MDIITMALWALAYIIAWLAGLLLGEVIITLCRNYLGVRV